MSVQAGIWNFDGEPVDPELLASLSAALKEQGPDGEMTFVDGSVGLLYRPFHTTLESHKEKQPYFSPDGFVLTWDGRLDNREDFASNVCGAGSSPQTDVALVAAAFGHDGTNCFGHIIGDFALSVWDPTTRTLILAKDYLGTRHLFYYLTSKRVIWCKYLDPIVLLCGAPLTLDDEYVAGYIASDPEAHLTPYREIKAVPPGTFVTIERCSATIHRYWHFQPKRRIYYATDAEYEVHFLHLFRQAVRRRLRSDRAILGELSGGIDSSSIICVADDLIAQGEAETPDLDTLSLYDSMEPAGDERAYFTLVERKRGKTGHHFDLAKYGELLSLDYHEFIVAPGFSPGIHGIAAALLELLQSRGYRVVLCGTGGDEFLGGVPNPLPQLADLVVQPQPSKLAKQIAAWSLVKRRPWIHLLYQTLVFLLPAYLRAALTAQAKAPSWIDVHFAHQHHLAIKQLGPQGRYGFWLPSRRENARTLVGMMRQFASISAHALRFEERRYPFLDQSLIGFLLSIPASQLIRPGQRRSLMRRALASIVPSEILWRKTKGAVVRSLLSSFGNHWGELEELFALPFTARQGYVDPTILLNSLASAKVGNAPQLVALLKTLSLELWLRSLVEHGILSLSANSDQNRRKLVPKTKA